MTLTEPTLNITFVNAAKESQERSERGIVALILKDTAVEAKECTVYDESDIPEGLSEENMQLIKMALIGNVNKPSRIEVFILEAEADSYSEALNYFADKPFIYMAIPSMESKDISAVEEWIKGQRDSEKHYSYKLVNVNPIGSDYEGIINFGTEKIEINDKEWDGAKFCARIAGMLAGTPVTQAATFSCIPEATGCSKMSRTERNTAVGKGQLIAFWDGEKVKLNRAVTSLTTTTDNKGDGCKKIKIVETMDMIRDDVTKLTQDNYFGKYANTYDNQCVLMAAIADYLKALGENVVQSYTLDFNIEKMKEYLVSKKKKTKDEVAKMKETDILHYNYDTNVFFTGKIVISDAIEDLDIPLVMEQ